MADDEQPRKMNDIAKKTFFARAGTTGIDGLKLTKVYIVYDFPIAVLAGFQTW